jgi:tetratricopeptide (TPR) repeat protein
METILKSAREALDTGELELALSMLDNEKLIDNSEAHFIRGEIYYKWQKLGDSLNSFQKVLDIAPENENAKTYVVMIKNILNFYNKELYNP